MVRQGVNYDPSRWTPNSDGIVLII